MKPDKQQDQVAAFPGSMEAGAASGDRAVRRAQAEMVEALARLVLDSVAKTNDSERYGKTQAGTPRARVGTRRT
jgi:RNA:NAD 2'-phosphotransferase (TPT1/KptA family)